MKYLILIGLIIVVVLEYAVIKIGKDADEEAERMYEEWKEKHERETGADDIQ